MVGLGPRQRPAMLTPHRATWRQVSRQVRNVREAQRPAKGLPQVQSVVVPEVSTKRPAVLPEEVGEA